VDVTGCLAGYRVWVRGRRFADFTTLTNASRIASALMTFEALGLLDCVRSPGEVVRGMFMASVAESASEGLRPFASDRARQSEGDQ
jgi:hypothetical protein